MAKKIVKFLQRRGVLGAFRSTFIFFYSIVKNHIVAISHTLTPEYQIHKRRMLISKQLAKKMNYTVGHGPFKGLILKALEDNWNGNMFLGMFEKEVLQGLFKISKKYDTLVNLGAADGYYSIGGLTAKLYDQTFSFEMLKKSRKNILTNAKLNRVQDKVRVFGKVPVNFPEKLKSAAIDLSRCVIICDIEGGEFGLFDEKNLRLLKKSILIIEIHDRVDDGTKKYELLQKRAAKYFKLTKITTGARDPSLYAELSELSDNERWLFCSEGRYGLTTWLKLDPKQII